MRLLTLLGIFVLTCSVFAGTLQDAYDACGSGNGYDKYLVLTPGTTYTGGLSVDSGKDSCIKGRYAKVSLTGNQKIAAAGQNTVLDVDHLVVYGDGNTTGLEYTYYAEGLVDFCTVYGHEYGIWVWSNTDVTIKNSIVSGNSKYGMAWYSTSKPSVTYCDTWGNSVWNYAEYCSG
jgi:parallel beta-helix repeat protein